MKNTLNKRLKGLSNNGNRDIPYSSTSGESPQLPQNKQNAETYRTSRHICRPLTQPRQAESSTTSSQMRSTSVLSLMQSPSLECLPHTTRTSPKSPSRVISRSTTGWLQSSSTGLRKLRSQSPDDSSPMNFISSIVAAFVLGLAAVSLGYYFGWNARGVEEMGKRAEFVDTTTAYADPQPKGGRFSF